MSDIDRVFARLGGAQPAGAGQRELRTIPRKGGTAHSRVVEVVRLPPRGAASGPPDRNDQGVRAQTWTDGFPARSTTLPSPEPVPAETREAVAHLMPMWTGTTEEPQAEARQDVPAGVAPSPARRRSGGSRRVADPFNAEDDGANCFRCGYAIEAGRERRGLETCASCG